VHETEKSVHLLHQLQKKPLIQYNILGFCKY